MTRGIATIDENEYKRFSMDMSVEQLKRERVMMGRQLWVVIIVTVSFFICFEAVTDSFLFAATEGNAEKSGEPKLQNSDQESNLRFMGMAEPWQRFSVVLLPGESLEQVHVKRDEQIKKGDPLIRLSNDQLANSIVDLVRKKNEIEYTMRQNSLTAMEIKLKEKYIAQIDEKINKEEELVEKISGYSSQLSKQLLQQKQQLSDQLTVLRAKHRMAAEVNQSNQKLTATLQDQIDRLTERQKQLDIKAPFDGTIFYIEENPSRAVPGRVVCELWNEQVVMVRGKIMQHQYSFVHSGDKVKISLEFSDEKSLDGIVYAIEQGQAQGSDPRLMRGYATFSVLIKVNHPRWLKPGMMVSIEMVSPLTVN